MTKSLIEERSNTLTRNEPVKLLMSIVKSSGVPSSGDAADNDDDCGASDHAVTFTSWLMIVGTIDKCAHSVTLRESGKARLDGGQAASTSHIGS